MEKVVKEATSSVNEANKSLRRVEKEFRKWKAANQPLNTVDPIYVELTAKVTACRENKERAQQKLVEVITFKKAQITAEKDLLLLLNRSPTLPLTIKDMLTNFDFPVYYVNCSPIFLPSWDERKFKELVLADGLEDMKINSPQNMLLLYNHVKSKYDCGQLLFECDDASQNFICRILDKRIMNEFIFLEPQPVTFGQYDGQALHFPSAARPLKRLIQFRAIVNRETAIERGYIQAEDYQYLMNVDNLAPGTKARFESIIEWNSKIPMFESVSAMGSSSVNTESE